MKEISVESGCTPAGKPFLVVRWGGEEGQLSPDGARYLAQNLLEGAEAAESDAMFFDWLGHALEMPVRERATVLASFRTHRTAARAKGEEAG